MLARRQWTALAATKLESTGIGHRPSPNPPAVASKKPCVSKPKEFKTGDGMIVTVRRAACLRLRCGHV